MQNPVEISSAVQLTQDGQELKTHFENNAVNEQALTRERNITA